MGVDIAAAEFTLTAPQSAEGWIFAAFVFLAIAWVLVRGSVSGLQKLTDLIKPAMSLVVVLGLLLAFKSYRDYPNRLRVDAEVTVEPRPQLSAQVDTQTGGSSASSEGVEGEDLITHSHAGNTGLHTHPIEP